MFGLTDFVGRAAVRAASCAALCLVVLGTGASGASAETRTLKIYHLHTHEKEEIAFKRNGRYLPDGLKKINWILRDWRKERPVDMDPRLLDLIWEAYRQSGSRAYINVVCGYRSPETNGMLRSRTSGVAKESQHMLGKAMDFFLPDVPLAKLRAIGLKMQVGGVGFYPRSGSPFVHFDVGNVRHWPKMSRQELLAVFPNGNTLHVPSDGRPLPGYEQAMASYKSRKSSSSIQVANAGDGPARGGGGGKTLFAMLFGGGADEEEDTAEAAAPAAAKARPEKAAPKPAEPVAVAAVQPKSRPQPLPGGVPMPIDDTFDTSEPKRPVPPAAIPNAEDADGVAVAMLDVKRIPLPSAAPAREPAPETAPDVALAAATVPVPTSPAGRDARGADAALVAALDAPAPAEAEADKVGQLAYAVPTPAARPPFAEILKTPAAAIAAAATANPAVAAPVAAPAPVVVAAAPAAPPPPSLHGKVLLASLEAPKKPLPAVHLNYRPVIPAGKTARVKTHHAAPVPTIASAAPSQKTISDRIQMANLVTADLAGNGDLFGAMVRRSAEHPTGSAAALAAGFAPTARND